MYGTVPNTRLAVVCAGDPEVDNARPVIGHDHVAGLEVPVYKAASVDRGQPLSQRGA